MTALHRYEVRLSRRVHSPLYGRNAYMVDTKKRDFPFGKNEKYKTGKDALEAAENYANEHFDIASDIEICKLHGGCGTCQIFKYTRELFSKGFTETATNQEEE
jgi:hypothetical protein